MLGFAAAACRREPDVPAWLRVRVTRPPKDTVVFEAAASARRCGPPPPGSGGLVLQGASGGNGALLWLRFPPSDSLASGEWPMLQRADTGARRGAVVGVRFMLGEVAHGAALDSGAVSLTRAGQRLSVRARGVGLEVAGAGRVAVDASFEAVPLGDDTVPCHPTP